MHSVISSTSICQMPFLGQAWEEKAEEYNKSSAWGHCCGRRDKRNTNTIVKWITYQIISRVELKDAGKEDSECVGRGDSWPFKQHDLGTVPQGALLVPGSERSRQSTVAYSMWLLTTVGVEIGERSRQGSLGPLTLGSVVQIQALTLSKITPMC